MPISGAGRGRFCSRFWETIPQQKRWSERLGFPNRLIRKFDLLRVAHEVPQLISGVLKVSLTMVLRSNGDALKLFSKYKEYNKRNEPFHEYRAEL